MCCSSRCGGIPARRSRPAPPFAQTRHDDAVVLALAADHVVGDVPAFVAACREGLVAAQAGRIVTFGVQPERPATEYGYISPGEVISGQVRSVAKFVEKPNPATAAAYIEAGYLWNSGNFMFRASVLLDEYRQVDAASVAAVTDSVASAGRDLGFFTLDDAAFGSAKAISIDYAVMEKTSRAAVVPVACGWSDVGSWRAVWELSDKDGEGNAAQARPCSRIPAIAMFRRTGRWSRSRASTTSWSSPPRTPCWCRGRRTPTG